MFCSVGTEWQKWLHRAVNCNVAGLDRDAKKYANYFQWSKVCFKTYKKQGKTVID